MICSFCLWSCHVLWWNKMASVQLSSILSSRWVSCRPLGYVKCTNHEDRWPGLLRTSISTCSRLVAKGIRPKAGAFESCWKKTFHAVLNSRIRHNYMRWVSESLNMDGRVMVGNRIMMSWCLFAAVPRPVLWTWRQIACRRTVGGGTRRS